MHPIAKLAARLAAWEELAQRSTSEHERVAADERAQALRRRLRRERAEELHEWRSLDIPETGGYGKARYQAMVSIVKAYGCILPVYGPGDSPRDRWGGFLLRFGGLGGLAEEVALRLPELLDEIDEASKAAVKVYNVHLRSLPDTDHDPQWRPSLRRRFRSDYIAAYGSVLAHKILLGGGSPDLPLSDSPEGFSRALADAAQADVRRLELGGGIDAPMARLSLRRVHVLELVEPDGPADMPPAETLAARMSALQRETGDRS
ncbi:hypothetical protein ACIBG8_07620 [Nonomuraea sp. NPDC050556]|uniref:hypothetical protein n=1 Tax=Nonomuraea sp. NPDC050556 TaxID=3364369 RepID=UPI0037BBD7CE